MSCSKWRWTEECDTHPCPGDCDTCSYHPEEAEEEEPEKRITSSGYQCFHCMTRGVVWDADFSFEDYGYLGEGIVQVCHCVNCGAEILYLISLEEEEDGNDLRD